jgi:hypothetical protein
VASAPQADTARLERERDIDRRARRDAVRRNAAKGVGRNLEEAIRLVRATDEFHAAFRTSR